MIRSLALLIVKVYPKLRNFTRKGTGILLCSLLICITACGQVTTVNETDFMMDTFIQQMWQGENARECYEEISSVLHKGEELLSTYDEGSEISLLNKMSGKEEVPLSKETFEILKRAREYSRLTKGKFDITCSPLVRLWNVTGENPHVPKLSDIENAKALIDYEGLVLNENRMTGFLKQEGMEIDLGAVLKGYFAGEALKMAEKHNVTGYISVGGNMAVFGKKDKNTDYTIGIRNPRGDANDYIGTLHMDGFTMATAGDYERFFEEDGERYHHIMDTSTGYPSKTDLISVTVLSKDGLLADFLSTYIFMEGKESLEKFKGYEGFSFLAVDKDLNVYGSEGFWEVFTPSDDKKEFNFLK